MEIGFYEVISLVLNSKIKKKIMLELKKSKSDYEKRIKFLNFSSFL